MNDEEATLEQLNKLHDTKHDIFFGFRIPRRRLPMEIQNVEIVDEGETEHINSIRNLTVYSKLLHHFIKRKFSLFPIETILTILEELESLENLVKLARKKPDEGLKIVNLTKVEGSHAIQRININKNCCNKMLHLLVEISNDLIKGLVDISASMSIMSAIIIQKLSIMHLVFGSEFYKIASNVVIQILVKINELLIQIGDVQCLMNFMVVDTNSYEILLELYFFIKMVAVIDGSKYVKRNHLVQGSSPW